MKEKFCFFLLLAAGYFGYELTTAFTHKHLDFISRLSIGSCFGILVLAFSFQLLSFFIDVTFIISLLLTIIFALSSFSIHYFRKNVPIQCYFSRIYIVFYIIIPSIFTLTLIYFGSYHKNMYVYGSQISELPVDISFISSILYGCNVKRQSLFSFKDPLLANKQLRFGILHDILSGYLIKCYGISIHASLFYPSIPFVFALFALLSILLYIFTNNSFQSTTFAFITFLFIGGRGYINLFNKDVMKTKTTDFIIDWGMNRYEYCLHPLLQMIIPQRSTLFSLPLCIAFILLLTSFDFGKQQRSQNYVFCALILAILPLVQLQAFLAMALWGLCYFVVCIIRDRGLKMNDLLTSWAILASITIICTYPLFKGQINELESIMQIKPLYKATQSSNIFSLWYNGFHFFFIYSFLHGVVAMDARQKYIFIPSAFVFVLSNFILFQKWHYDNLKVLLAGWIPLAAASIGNFLSKIWAKTTKRAILFFVFIVLPLWTSGCLFFCGSITTISMLFDHPKQAIALSEWAKENTSPDSIWVVDGSFAIPAIALAGRQGVIGFPHYISTRKAIDDESRIHMISKLIDNPNDTLLSDSYDVEFVCSDSSQNEPTHFSPKSSNKWEAVFNNVVYIVYKRTSVN